MSIGTMTLAPVRDVQNREVTASITYAVGNNTWKTRAFSLKELSQLLSGGVFPPEKVADVLQRMHEERPVKEENVELSHELMHFLEFRPVT